MGQRSARRYVGVLGLLLLAALVSAPGALADPPPLVIVLSWDGVRRDYPDRGEFPALARMAREGVRAERLASVFPANTFPAHVSMATGTYPDRHGIVGNRFRDRERGLFDYDNDASWIEAEPLWAAAERQGRRAAVFFWVGSETDWNGIGASYRKTPFDSAVSEEQKVDQILAWIDLPAAQRPALIMSWWHGTDRAGHRKGPDHDDVARALAEQDRQLERLFAGLDRRDAWRHATVFVVSDHGMTLAREFVDLKGPLAKHGIAAEVLSSSGAAYLYLEDAGDLDRAESLLRSLPDVEVYRAGALPERLRLDHPARIGDLVAVAAPPSTFSRSRLPAFLGGTRGMHGYAPEHPDMAAIFFALGRGVPRGRALGPVRSIDLAPTVAALLGIEPPRHSEGRPIPGIGVDGASSLPGS